MRDDLDEIRKTLKSLRPGDYDLAFALTALHPTLGERAALELILEERRNQATGE